MRYSRMQSPPKKRPSKPAAFMAFVLICGAAIYFIGAGKVGNFLSERVITPVLSFVTGNEAEPAETLLPNEASETVSVDGLTLYAIQAGVFSEESHASSLAKSMRLQGGAGYIREDNGFRVLLSAYTSSDDAATVKDRLKEKNDMDTAIYKIESKGADFSVTADVDSLAVIRSAVDGMKPCMEKLYATGAGFDKGTIAEADIAAELKETRQKALELRDSLDSLNSDSELIRALHAFYVSAVERIDSISSESGTAAMSAELKYAYLALVFQYAEILK